MIDVLLTERDEARVLSEFAKIAGETLGVDRSLIYEFSAERGEIAALSEWLNPDAPALRSTAGIYPMSTFGGGLREVLRTRTPLVSHAEAPHPALVADGSAELLHGTMAIRSLLWFPFDFSESKLHALVFNQVTRAHEWTAEELEFLRLVTGHVDLALMQIKLRTERADAERAVFEAQKSETVSVLAAGVAHDFNNLLGVVLSAVSRVQIDLAEDDPNRKILAQAGSAAREAAELSRSLLAYAGGGQSLIMPLDLVELADDMQDLLRAAAGKTPLRFLFDGPAHVVGDAGQLRQTLLNFVINAVEAQVRPGGEIRVQIALENADGDAPKVLLCVSDDGPGMPSEIKQRIFEPFFSTKDLGRGLGLAAVAGITRAHGAEMEVESEPGVGTTFSVRFPAVVPKRLSVARPKQGTTLLLVDDNDNFRRMCATLLSDLGFRTLEANNGSTALELVQSRTDVDAVVLDLLMPAPTGVETFRMLRAYDPRLPVVVTSGYAGPDAAELLALGHTSFLEKPFTVEQFEAALREVLPAKVS